MDPSFYIFLLPTQGSKKNNASAKVERPFQPNCLFSFYFSKHILIIGSKEAWVSISNISMVLPTGGSSGAFSRFKNVPL